MTTIIDHASLDWKVPPGGESDRGDLRRASITDGEAGFHSHVVDCPPGYVLPEHSHDHGELFIVIGGSAIVGDRTLHAFDTVAIPAGAVYGLVAGSDGLQFMVVRSGAATLNLAP